MSKMSQLHAELTEQAQELGFESIEEAEANGYHVAYTGNRVKLAFDAAKAQEEAHKALLEEKDEVVNRLGLVSVRSYFDKQTIERAIKLINEEVK